jgi:hypothetical protein
MKNEFWSGLGWGLLWLGLFSGLALWTWSVAKSANYAEQVCVSNGGSWVYNSKEYGNECQRTK